MTAVKAGDPAPLGSMCWMAYVLAAGRNNGPAEPLVFSPWEVKGLANYLLGAPFASISGLLSNPIPASPNVAAMAKRYVQANSVVLGMPRQTRPAALDGGRYGFYTVLDHIPIDHRTARCEFWSDTYAAPIVRIMPSMIPKNMRIQAPFCPERFPKTWSGSPKISTRTLAIVFVSGQARRVISVRERQVKNTLRARAKARELGGRAGNGGAICRVHSTAGSNVGGKVPSRAFGK